MSAASAEFARDDAERYKHLVTAGELWLRSLNDPDRAIELLRRAHTVKPTECEATILLADALSERGDADEASSVLVETATALKGRRVRELSGVQHRLARIAISKGDQRGALAWLTGALENDMQSGPVASDLADVAMSLREYETALKALRAIALMKSPGPMTRAMAFHRQAIIALEQNDKKKAVFYAKKAAIEDPTLIGAATLLKTLQDEG
jgi:tetratricopeptide (TPR) repeat protein